VKSKCVTGTGWEGENTKNVATIGSETVGPDSKYELEQKNRLSIRYVAQMSNCIKLLKI
jgi:hypothetical protein